jgi:transcriptional regulator with XRE-family HTH domain
MDINLLIARRVRELRDAQRLSLDALATRSGVSRSNISLIERGESSPTAAVLDKLASALGVALAALFEDKGAPEDAPSPLARVAEQPVWTDPASGYMRRSLSPAAPSPLQLVDVVFPPGQRVAYDSVPHNADIHQQVWMIEARWKSASATNTGGWKPATRWPCGSTATSSITIPPASSALSGRADHATEQQENRMNITIRRIGAGEARERADALAEALSDVLIDCVKAAPR